MPRIQQLPPSVITKIAAGEVIERPSSVVKELLENSVDAGSTRIEIDVEQGGIDLIRVVDDGCGIVPDDMPLAFSSHATSKLQDADDLFRIASLGFRGEALASIGGVAQVGLQSRTHELNEGAEMQCHGGDMSDVRVWNGSPGTRIEVRHLFFNTPVRRKFLKTTATELGHITETFTRIALAHPRLHLILRHQGKLVYEVPESADLAERIGLFFGQALRDQLHDVDVARGPARLHGYIADPACERGNAKLQYLFLNGRWFRDRSLSHALQEAYRGLLMTGRYAVAFLFLDMPPDLVDVNVHPTKSEVRFRDANAAHHLVFTTIRDRLRSLELTPRLTVPAYSFDKKQPLPGSVNDFVASLKDEVETANQRIQHASAGTATAERGTAAVEEEWVETEETDALETEPDKAQGMPPQLFAPPPAPKAIQLHNAYIVVETPDGMLVIDQHALHERILFEEFKERLNQGSLEMQRLLIPQPIDLPAEQAACALHHRDALLELGLEVSDFGGGTLLLSGYPALLSRNTPDEILRTVLDHLLTQDRPPSREVLLNDLLSIMACRAAVKAGDFLTEEEIQALLEQKHLARDTHHCPHGRPTSLLFSRQELDRQFRRI